MSKQPLSPAERDRAMNLLRRAVAKPSSIAAVARSLGYTRPALSRLLSGSYGDSDTLLRTALQRLDSVGCPHTGREEPRALCAEQSAAEPPTHNPFRLAHWHACRRCEHFPEAQS